MGLVLGRIHVVAGVGNWACTGHYSILSLVVDYCSYQVEVLLSIKEIQWKLMQNKNSAVEINAN